MTITTEEAEECARGQDAIKEASKFPGYRSIAERCAATLRSLAAERDALRQERDAAQLGRDIVIENNLALRKDLEGERDALRAEIARLLGPPIDKAERKKNLVAAGVSEKTADEMLRSPVYDRHSRWEAIVDPLEAENARLREALRAFIYTGNVVQGYRVGQNPPPPTTSEEEAWAHYGGSEFHYQQWLQWRAVQIGRELLGEKK